MSQPPPFSVSAGPRPGGPWPDSRDAPIVPDGVNHRPGRGRPLEGYWVADDGLALPGLEEFLQEVTDRKAAAGDGSRGLKLAG